jgi:hypothetical protein
MKPSTGKRKRDTSPRCYWYYNKKYSETGRIASSIRSVLEKISQDKNNWDHPDEIKKEVRKRGKSEGFNGFIRILPPTPELIQCLQSKQTVYILSNMQTGSFICVNQPTAIFATRWEAQRHAIRSILKVKPFYHWRGSLEPFPLDETQCDYKWLQKIFKDVEIEWEIGQVVVFERDIEWDGNIISSIEKTILNKEDDWNLIWREFIQRDSWCVKARIEEVAAWKIDW